MINAALVECKIPVFASVTHISAQVSEIHYRWADNISCLSGIY